MHEEAKNKKALSKKEFEEDLKKDANLNEVHKWLTKNNQKTEKPKTLTKKELEDDLEKDPGLKELHKWLHKG